MNMYRDRGGGGSSKAGEMLDRKRINDALDKHLEKSSPSTSRNKGSAVAVPSTSAAAGKHVDPRDTRSSSALTASKNKLSDGALFVSLFLIFFFFLVVCVLFYNREILVAASFRFCVRCLITMYWSAILGYCFLMIG